MSTSLKDPRAYLQRRVALFARVASALFAVLLVADFATPAEEEALFSSTRVASIIVIVTSGFVWALLRMAERPAWVCRALELTMVAAMGSFAALPLFPPIEGAGGVMAMFSPIFLGLVVLTRAAIIPSPAWLSVVVGLVWGSAMTVSGALGWERVEVFLPEQGVHEAWILPASFGGLATVTFSVVAGVISHVVYGLQSKVRAAMELGQYTLETKIGEGGMGAVYRARHRMLRRPTAVKLLPPERAGEDAIARFEREVQQTSRLTHPNTVAIFDYGRTDDGVFYYAMEYLEGISLQELVDRHGALPPGRVVHILSQAAEALSEAHEAGLVHRDIKPDNIFLCERGGVPDVVKVLDFGLVKDVEAPKDAALSAAGTILGTPLYMAPEALAHPDSVDARADLYSLAAVAHFLLTGEAIFDGSVVEVLGHHLHTKAPSSRSKNEEVPADLDALVLRALEKDPEERFQSAAEMARALERSGAAAAWSRDQARAWWDAERDAILAMRERRKEPANLTLAPA